MKTQRLCGVLLLLGVLVSGSVRADTLSWIGGSGHPWGAPSSWSTYSSVPQDGDTAAFINDDTYTVRVMANTNSLDDILFYRGEVELNISNNASPNSPTVFTDYFYIGIEEEDSASVNITGGGTLDVNVFYLGYDFGSTGKLTVNNGEIDCSRSFVIGREGSGELLVESGGLLSVNNDTRFLMGYLADSYGKMTLSNSAFNSGCDITCGLDGSAEIVVESGGSLSANSINLGEHSGAGGTLTVSNGTVNFSDTICGLAGSGEILVESGGSFSTDNFTVGGYSGSNGLVVVRGGSIECNNNVVLGDRGSGELLVESGGSFSANNRDADFFLGKYNGTDGKLTVSNGTVNVKNMICGFAGSGEILVESGGLLSAEYIWLGNGTGPYGILTVDNGTVNCASIEIDSGGTGAMTVKNGSTVNVSGTIETGSNGTLSFKGGTLTASSVDLLKGGFNWTGGELHITGSGGLDVNSSGDIASLYMSGGTTLTVDNALNIGSGGSVVLAGGTSTSKAVKISNYGSLSLFSGSVNCDRLSIGSGSLFSMTDGTLSTNSIELSNGAIMAAKGFDLGDTSLSGYGTVSGALSGGAESSVTVTASKTMNVGSLSSTDGYDVAGSLSVGSGSQLVLLDADYAQLGTITTLGDGATLNGVNGLELGVGETLTASGSAMIEGYFHNQGTVNGSTEDGKYLTFNDNVSGAGSYSGNVQFLQGFAPGNSPAIVSFSGGNVSYGASSTLEMEIYGLAENLFDRLVDIDTLSADGTLKIIFGTDYAGYDGYLPSVGDSFDLFDFVTFAGSFKNIVISGLDSSLMLDTSLLSSTGVITVVSASAQEVPEPKLAAVLFLCVLAVIYKRRRSETAAK